MDSLTQHLILLRPTHWIKNALLFAGLIFAGQAGDKQAALTALGAFAVFCALSSLVYVINDIFDRDQDRKHPLKSKRPLASGKVSLASAWILAGALLLVSFQGAQEIGEIFLFIAVAYLLNSFLYTAFLKQIVIIDVMAIAVGFVLRAWAGAAAIDVRFDAGLFITTFVLALFLGFGKRRHELVLLGKENAPSHRLSLNSYSAYFLDQLIGIASASAVIVYTMYVISPEVEAKLGSQHLWTTVPFVIYGVFRYLYLTHIKEKGGSPTRLLLTDMPLLVDVLLWLSLIVYLMYLS